MIPLFQVEEHHEAFLVWHYAIRRELMPASGNTLLHVDEHSDWAVPRLRHPLESLDGNLARVAEFTYSELDIGNFIWPAVYQGIFGEVYWMRRGHNATMVRRRIFIRAANAERTEFLTGLDSGSNDKTVAHDLITPASFFAAAGPVVLDIDLDYFSSHPFPDSAGRKLEVTAEAFREFTENRYHFLRISPGARITAAREDGHYFLYFGDQRPRAAALSIEEIATRLDEFTEFLTARRVNPSLVVLCRSRLSGYTPAEHWEFIESQLLRRLGDLYPLEIQALEIQGMEKIDVL